MYSSEKVAEHIKYMAKQRNITVKQLLNDAGLSFNTMANMRTSMPNSDNLAKIADVLGCSVDYLLGRTDYPDVNGIDDEQFVFWKRFTNMCDEKNCSPASVTNAMDLPVFTAAQWKNGAIPTGEVLIMLANYFDCSIDYLLGRTDCPDVNKNKD